jgi:hypothetical protein
LHGSESVTITFPNSEVWPQEQIIASLCGSIPIDGLLIHASVALVEPVRTPSGWLQWLRPSTPFDWMKKNTKLSDKDILEFLRQNHIEQHVPVKNQAGTPRLMLGLAAAYARFPQVILFSTAGQPPLGVQQAFDYVLRHLADCSAIYLAWPYWQGGVLRNEVLPGSVQITVSKKKITAAVA